MKIFRKNVGNYVADSNIIINPQIPLEEQNIDEKTYLVLDRIISKINY